VSSRFGTGKKTVVDAMARSLFFDFRGIAVMSRSLALNRKEEVRKNKNL
jgi:hypothetical protein